jgi:hypothetical protein
MTAMAMTMTARAAATGTTRLRLVRKYMMLAVAMSDLLPSAGSSRAGASVPSTEQVLKNYPFKKTKISLLVNLCQASLQKRLELWGIFKSMHAIVVDCFRISAPVLYRNRLCLIVICVLQSCCPPPKKKFKNEKQRPEVPLSSIL